MFQPVSENIVHCCLHLAANGDPAIPVIRTMHYSPHSFAVVGLSTWNSLPVSLHDKSLILMSFYCLSLHQSICFISMLVTVISLLERSNITISYVQCHTFIHMQCTHIYFVVHAVCVALSFTITQYTKMTKPLTWQGDCF